MGYVKRIQKGTAVAVVLPFLAAVFITALPQGLVPAAATGWERTVATIEKAMEGSGAFEKENERDPALKKKHFPWLWVAAGTVAVGAIVYFLVIKKPNYKLTVELDASVSGLPLAGIYSYRKGKSVAYGFIVKPGFSGLKVLLDGQEVAASGVLRMDKDHALKVSAQEITYKLAVSLAKGVSGSPATGASTRHWQEKVDYAYTLDEGYQNLKVLLDGEEAPAQGTITMDCDHSLEATTEAIPPPPPPEPYSEILGYWHIVLVSSTGVRTEGTINFIYLGTPGLGQRALWRAPYPWPGIGFWTLTMPSIVFTGPDEGPWENQLRADSAMPAVRAALEHWQWVECQGSFSDAKTMSGTFRRFFQPQSGPISMIGTGTWSATRL